MQGMLKQTFDPNLQDRTIVLRVTALCGGPSPAPLFEHLTLQLPAGVSVLLGDEGAGKTSLMRLLSGDLALTTGQIHLTGHAATLALPQLSAVFWIDLRLPQHDNDTPLQCWEAYRDHLATWSDVAKDELIVTLQMTPHLDKKLSMLSTGSRRKVGLIMALASGAKVTLLDQPFVSLDQSSVNSLQAFLAHAGHCHDRAWLIADYEKPACLAFVSVLQL